MIEVEVNHSERLGPPRNQGRRPTCLVFTTSDLNAFANATPHLSVEFLCHHAAKAEESWEPGDGFTVDQVFTAVASPGQPEEDIYPYRPDSQDAPLQAPPSGLMPLYRSPSNTRALTLSEVTALVRQGRAVGLVMAVTKSLFYPRDGVRPICHSGPVSCDGRCGRRHASPYQRNAYFSPKFLGSRMG